MFSNTHRLGMMRLKTKTPPFLLLMPKGSLSCTKKQENLAPEPFTCSKALQPLRNTGLKFVPVISRDGIGLDWVLIALQGRGQEKAHTTSAALKDGWLGGRFGHGTGEAGATVWGKCLLWVSAGQRQKRKSDNHASFAISPVRRQGGAVTLDSVFCGCSNQQNPVAMMLCAFLFQTPQVYRGFSLLKV